MSVAIPTRQDAPDPNAVAPEHTHETPLHGLIAVDAERRIVAMDPEVELMLGVGARQLIGKPAGRLPAPLGECISRSLDGAEPCHDQEAVIPTADGATRAISFNVRSLQAGGDGRLAVATLLDVTAIREVEASTARLERLASIGTLSASMAHEIKNALVAVRTFTELLAREHPEAELAGVASREVRRIDSLVSQMLRFGGLGRPTFAPLRLNEVVAHACRLVHHQLAQQRVVLRQSLSADPDTVSGDSYQLHQALLNLFFNAIEAMPSGGELTLHTEFVPLPPSARSDSPDMHSCVRVTVTDNGPGISAENLVRMFEPFFTTKPKGTGLGLPITRRIVKEHGGTIAVESQPGHGTTISLVFPAAS